MTSESPIPWRPLLDAAVRAHETQPTARYAQLATVRPDGRPANRTVVVRGLLDPGGRPLVSTDARTAKFGHLSERPWAELCWYFPDTREQFRLLGRATLVGEDGDAARSRVWSALPYASRKSFTWPPPGAPLDDASAFHPDAPAPDTPPACFTLIVLDPEEVEHLDLRPQLHKRTRFRRRDETREWSEEPINP